MSDNMSPYMVTNISVYFLYISQSQKKSQESKGNRKLDIYKCPFLETQKKFQKQCFSRYDHIGHNYVFKFKKNKMIFSFL
mgnify:CR=1 FL=1